MFADADLPLAELADQIARAPAPTPALVTRLIAAIHGRSGQVRSATTARINALIEAKAWTETALALVELALPQWKLRRLIYQDGSWLCSLSRQWNLPEWLADCAESRHESLPLAILGAVIEAHHCGEPPVKPTIGSVPKCRLASDAFGAPVCCDNFS